LSWSGRTLERLEAAYREALGWALTHRRPLIASVLGCAAIALLRLPLIGTEFFPPSNESQFIIRLRGPVGTRVGETERAVVRIENIIRTTLKPEEYTALVSSIGVLQGRAGLCSQNTGPPWAQIQVYLSPPDQTS
jgi:multidrug efflux pump subunit AcrB